MVTFEKYLAHSITIKVRESRVNLDCDAQRALIIFLWKNRPELMREVMCENCPEHMQE